MKLAVVFPDALDEALLAPDPDAIRHDWLNQTGRRKLSISTAVRNEARLTHGTDRVDAVIGTWVKFGLATEFCLAPVQEQNKGGVSTHPQWHHLDNRIAVVIRDLRLEQRCNAVYRECLIQFKLLQKFNWAGVVCLTSNQTALQILESDDYQSL